MSRLYFPYSFLAICACCLPVLIFTHGQSERARPYCMLPASAVIQSLRVRKGSPYCPCSCTCHSYSLSGIDVLYMLIHEMINTNGCFIYPFSYLRFFVFDFFYVGSLRFERLVGCYNTQTVCCIRALSTA